MCDDAILQVDGLTKRFRTREAVSDLSFCVAPGRVTGLLGPSGSGKTTTVNMILGLLRPSAGSALITGMDYWSLPHPARTVGAVLENARFAPRRTARRYLWMFAPAVDADFHRVSQVLEMVGLSQDADTPVREFPRGMRQRLAIGAALMGDPRLLVLDEPASGLDPIGLSWLRDLLGRLSAKGVAVLLTGNLMSGLDRALDDVVMLNRSHVVFCGTRSELVGQRSVLSVGCDVRGRALLDIVGAQSRVTPLPDGRYLVDQPHGVLQETLRAHRIDRGEVDVAVADLESAFMLRTALSGVDAR